MRQILPTRVDASLALVCTNGTELDPVAADVEAVRHAVEHCNADHADAVLDMSRAFTGLKDIETATMLSIDRFGFNVLCQTKLGPRQGSDLSRSTNPGSAALSSPSPSTTQGC